MTTNQMKTSIILKSQKIGMQIIVKERFQKFIEYTKWIINRQKKKSELLLGRLFPQLRNSGFIRLPIQHQWKNILKESGNILESVSIDSKEPPVLFMTIWTESSPVLNALESILAYAIRLNGVRTISLGCHKTFPACVYDPLGNRSLPVPYEWCFTSYSARSCRNCVNGHKAYYPTNCGIERASFKKYFEKDDFLEAIRIVEKLNDEACSCFIYRDINVGEHAYSSTLRALGRGTLLDDPFHIWLLKRQLIAGIAIVHMTERALDDIQPRRVMAVHGIYIDHGTTCEVARKKGYPIVIYSIPYRKDAIMLCHGDTYHRALVTEPSSLWKNEVLSEKMEKKLDDYVISRQRGTKDSITYHPNPIEDHKALIQALDLVPYKPIVSLFTNVIWDAQLYHAYNAFNDILDWLFKSVEYFIRRPDVQWVIRIHPAEVKATKKTKQPLADELKNRFNTLPSHIKIVKPESDLSSYSLVDISTAAIIYGTKMGLEIALRGVPVIVAGESFNRGKGFTYDVSSEREYFDLLNRVTELPSNSNKMMVMAKRYAYHFYFKRQIDFPFLTGFVPGDRYSMKLTFESLEDLLPGNNQNLDTICKGILEGTEFVGNPGLETKCK